MLRAAGLVNCPETVDELLELVELMHEHEHAVDVARVWEIGERHGPVWASMMLSPLEDSNGDRTVRRCRWWARVLDTRRLHRWQGEKNP